MTISVDRETQSADAAGSAGSSDWTPVCRLADLEPLWGEAAIVGGEQIALFRLADGRLYAVSNVDPATQAAVMSRGIVGSRGDTPTIASPLLKDVYELATGRCLTKAGLTLAVWRIRVEDEIVLVAPPQ